MIGRKWQICLVVVSLLTPLLAAQNQSTKPKPRVIVVGVNGMELDVIRPLILKGQMPNLAHIIKNGAYGKFRTVPAPNCPKAYTAMFTSIHLCTPHCELRDLRCAATPPPH